MTDTSHNALEQATTMSGRPSGFRSMVGYRCIRWERDAAEIELLLTADHTNSLGIVHGGVVMTIMDAAMGHAATWCAIKGNVRLCVTLAMSTNFMTPARGKVIRASARLVGVHNRIATLTGDVSDDRGTLVATGQASFRYATGSERYEGVARASR